MALTKRGKYWHFEFIYKGKRYQGSTGQTNINKARLAIAAIRSNAALEVIGIAPPKVSPLFKDFMEGRFLAHVRQHANKPRTIEFYEARTARLVEHFAAYRLSDIDEDLISKYKADRAAGKKRLGKGPIADGTINRELATLRKALGLAFEWKLIPRIPRTRRLPGEKERIFVLTPELEAEYLTSIDYPLRQAAVLTLDIGLRPEECVRLRKSDIDSGELQVRDGKSSNARRRLPMTQRAKAAVELLSALFPDSEWLFKGRKEGSHMTRAHLDHLHEAARDANGWPREFVLYSCRHTFGTRLAESGATPFEIKEAMGHGDIRVSQKYVHLSSAHLATALKRKELKDTALRDATAPSLKGDPAGSVKQITDSKVHVS